MINDHTDLCIRLNEIDGQVKDNFKHVKACLIDANRSVYDALSWIKRLSDLINTMDSIRGSICRLRDKEEGR